jgi:hypothetical protein
MRRSSSLRRRQQLGESRRAPDGEQHRESPAEGVESPAEIDAPVRRQRRDACITPKHQLVEAL